MRAATEADVPAITAIYNEAVLTTTASFDVEPRSVEDRLAWFRSHDPRHPILVAVVDGAVVGWASLSPWSERCAYDATGEESVYVLSTHRRRGLGRRLLESLLAAARGLGYHTVIGRITTENGGSLRLHRELGFLDAGCLREVGVKFGRRLDVAQLQVFLDGRARAPSQGC